VPSSYAHFIGVGGAGMSGIALVLAERGVCVTGSDLKESRYSRALARAGVRVSIGHAADNLGDPEIVVISSAIPEHNPELMEARRRNIPVWPRAEMLAHLAGERQTVAVAGTHGKTSTSSMVATMLHHMGLAPTFLIGGEVDGFDSNAVNGAGAHYVVEADESDGSFVYLSPHIAVITNVEADHMDHYASLDEIEATFAEFAGRTAPDGAVVACADDAAALRIATESGRRVVSYGFCEGADVRCEIEERVGLGFRATMTAEGGRVSVTTCVPGLHMVSNAAAAIACAVALGLDVEAAAAAVSRFSGVRRRFDLIGDVAGVTIVDDYAHHPTEVKATLDAAAGLGFDRLWVLFQPHRYTRTAAFSDEFGSAFASADHVVLMDVYSAGEAPVPGVSGKTIVSSVLRRSPQCEVAYFPHRADIVSYLSDRLKSGDLIMTMGAGDVTSVGPEIASALAGEGPRCH